MLPGERRWQDYPHCWRHCSAWRAHVWVGGEGSAMTHGGRVRRALAAAGVRALRLAAGGSAPGFQQTVSAKVGGRRREKLPRRCRSAWKCRAEVTVINGPGGEEGADIATSSCAVARQFHGAAAMLSQNRTTTSLQKRDWTVIRYQQRLFSLFHSFSTGGLQGACSVVILGGRNVKTRSQLWGGPPKRLSCP